MAARKQEPPAFDQRVLTDMMRGSGVWLPGTGGTAKKAARRLVARGYVRREDDPYIDRPQYVITAKGRDFVLARFKTPGTIVYKRWVVRGQRRGEYQRRRESERRKREKRQLEAALRAEVKRG